MATDITVTLIGNLTDDPELGFTANGAAVCNFRVAVTARIKDGTPGATATRRSTGSPPGGRREVCMAWSGQARGLRSAASVSW
jgi:hypothetical protein